MLIDGQRGLAERAEAIPDEVREVRQREAVARLVRLYEAWSKPEEAARWRERLPLLRRTHPDFRRSLRELKAGAYIIEAEAAAMPMKVRDAIKRVERDGWVLVRQTGSHRQYHHPSKPGTVTIAGKPALDLDPKTERSIRTQAGLN